MIVRHGRRALVVRLFARFTKEYNEMSRIGKMPVELPNTVTVKLDGQNIHIKGSKGELHHTMHSLIGVNVENDVLTVTTKDESIEAGALSGTTRSLLKNMVMGVTDGFEKKLDIVGVGYRAQVQGKKLNLSLGHLMTRSIQMRHQLLMILSVLPLLLSLLPPKPCPSTLVLKPITQSWTA